MLIMLIMQVIGLRNLHLRCSCVREYEPARFVARSRSKSSLVDMF